MLAEVKGKVHKPAAGLAAGALEAGLEAAALAGAAGLAGITALAFSSMPTTWSFEAGCRKTRVRLTSYNCFSLIKKFIHAFWSFQPSKITLHKNHTYLEFSKTDSKGMHKSEDFR